jgi:hypothetical protein
MCAIYPVQFKSEYTHTLVQQKMKSRHSTKQNIRKVKHTAKLRPSTERGVKFRPGQARAAELFEHAEWVHGFVRLCCCVVHNIATSTCSLVWPHCFTSKNKCVRFRW